MSTKLYNGIKFKSKNIREVLDQLISIRKKAREIALDLISDESISLFIASNNLLDKDAWFASRELAEALDSDYNKWNFVPRLHFSVVVYPTIEGDIYGYYFDSDKKEFYDLLSPFFEDFHYQNQTDPPMDIHSDEWDFRREKWDELLPGDKFKDTGLVYDIVTGDSLDIWDLQDRFKIVFEKIKRDKKIENLGIK